MLPRKNRGALETMVLLRKPYIFTSLGGFVLAQTVVPRKNRGANVLFYQGEPYIFTSLGGFVLAQTVLRRKNCGALETYCFIEDLPTQF